MAEFSLKLTQGGAELLAKAKLGKQLNFKYITLGSGVFEGNPEEATAFVNKVIDLNIQEKTRKDTVAFLKATLTYNAVPDGFVWTELGVIAIDPDTQEEVLYMYDAIDIGEVIPPATAATQIEKVIQVASYVSNAPNISVVIDESLINIPRSDVGKPNGVAPLGPNTALEIEYGGTGAKTAQEALYNLGAGVSENLADNPDFKINQKGKVTAISGELISDRWQVAANTEFTVQNNNGDIIMNNTGSGNLFLIQKHESSYLEENEIYTLSVLTNEGLFFSNLKVGESNYPTDGLNLAINKKSTLELSIGILAQNSFAVYFVKCEKGTRQTLGYKVADGQGYKGTDWQLFENPDYINNLAKCKRYQQIIESAIPYSGQNYDNNFIDFVIPGSIEMRTTPSIANDSSITIRDSKGSEQSGFTFAILRYKSGALLIRATKESHGFNYSNPVHLISLEGNCILDANL